MIGARSIDQAGGTLNWSWNHADLPNVQYFAISRRIRMRIARIATFIAFGAAPAAQAACDWQQISPGSGKFTVNRMLVDLGEGDETVKPSSWQGPIRIARFKGTWCTVDASVGIVVPPLFAAGSILLVTTFPAATALCSGWKQIPVIPRAAGADSSSAGGAWYCAPGWWAAAREAKAHTSGHSSWPLV